MFQLLLIQIFLFIKTVNHFGAKMCVPVSTTNIINGTFDFHVLLALHFHNLIVWFISIAKFGLIDSVCICGIIKFLCLLLHKEQVSNLENMVHLLLDKIILFTTVNLFGAKTHVAVIKQALKF